jgi:serine/threonine protein phosphatase 1
MRYVMADIHGQYAMLETMLEEIAFGADDQLVVLGDLTDRGPESLAVIRFLMRQNNVQVIRGNHDQMILDYFAGKAGARERWMRNGGGVTKEALLALSNSERLDILDWLASLPLYILLDEYILVHAGLRMRPHTSVTDLLAQQELNDLIWIREDFYAHPAVPGHKVIFGHTRTPRLWGSNKAEIWYDPVHHDKIGIDCGAHALARGGRLACLCLDDNREFYVPSLVP